MGLLIGGLISGAVIGLLYALLGFAIVLLYKSTGVANFAEGTLATIGTFAAFRLFENSVPLSVAILLSGFAAAALGAAVYFIAVRPRESAGHLNLTIRTFAVYLIGLALLNASWAVGQPFQFPSIFSTGPAFTIGGVIVSWNSVGAFAVAAVLTVTFGVMFRFTKVGLALLAMAENPEVARLLGIRTQALTLFAWVLSTAVALVVGLMVAPAALLSSGMMEPYLLIGISAAVIGGLTDLSAVFPVGIGLGAISSVSALYVASDVSAVIVLGLLVAVLFIRPYGLVGRAPIDRL